MTFRQIAPDFSATGQIVRFHDAWEELPGPMLGYCRSGARAGSLHATLAR